MATVDVLRYSLELDSKKFVAQSKKAEAQTKKLSNSIGNKLTGAIQGMVGAWLGYRALNIIGDLVKTGAQAEATAMAFRNMFGAQTDIISQMRAASKGTIAEVQMMTIAMKANVMGIAQETLPQLMEVARASAIAFGRSTEFMFDSIVTGIARKQPLILDNLGIIFNLVEVYRKETERLGHELSEAEKSQAILNATIAAGQETIRKVGVDAKTAAEEIQSLAAAWTDLTTEIGKATTSVTGAGGWLSTIMDQVAWRIKLNRLEMESYEQRRKAAAFIGPVPIKGFDIPLFTQTVTAARLDLRKTLDEFDVASRKVLHDLNLLSTQQLKEYYETMLREYNLTAEQIKAIEKEIFNLRVSLYKEYLEELVSMLKQAEDIKAPMVIPVMIPEFIGPEQDFEELIQVSVFDKIELAIQEAAPAIMGAFDAIVANMDAFTASMLRAAQALATGDIYTAVNQFVSQWVKIFMGAAEFDRQASEMQRRALERLSIEIERNIAALDRMTFAMREQREEAIRQRIAFLERALQARGGLAPGVIEQYEREIEGLRQELDRLFELMGDASALEGIQSLQDLITFLGGMGDLDFQTAQQIARHFTRMFDLSIEEQIELWELIQGILIENGNITGEGLWAIQEILHDLYQQSEDQHEEIIEDIEDPDESQIMRSITMITEHQANLMVSILNSIYITLREFLEEFKSMAANYNYGGMTGGGGTVGPIYVSGGVSGDVIAESINREYRARGMKVG